MKTSQSFSLKLLGVLVASSVSTVALANEPVLSNSQFQSCLSGLKNTNAFKGVSGSTFENYRPSEPDPSVIRSLTISPNLKKMYGIITLLWWIATV